MNVSRRGFLKGLLGGSVIVAFPAIVRSESLMKIIAPDPRLWIPELRLILPEQPAMELTSVQPMPDDLLVGCRGPTKYDVDFYYAQYAPSLVRPSCRMS